MGSSASAVLAGLLGANSLLDEPFSREEILALASELEGHPDNVAPALLGGLVVSVQKDAQVFTRSLPLAAWEVVVVTPELMWQRKRHGMRSPSKFRSATRSLISGGRCWSRKLLRRETCPFCVR